MEPIKLNREQKRKYKKQHAHDKWAHYCPYCKMNTVWKMGEDNNVVCEICANVLFKVPDTNSDGEVATEPTTEEIEASNEST